MSTPREDGLRMPAEWTPHQATLMEWPTITRAEFWGDLFDRAKADWATMANAVAAFEPVVMVTDPEQASEARAMCGEGVEILPMPIDDSWMRDNGPIFVTDANGGVALVHFRFNSWGHKYLPFDRDAEVPKHVAAHLGMRRYEPPMVLEGGSIFVDGEGTLLTTEQCLLHPNRNPDMTREQIERTLGDYLGVERVIWLGQGHPLDRDTDGHIDAILQYLGPGRVLLDIPGDPADPYHVAGQDNLARLRAARDAAGRPFEIVGFDAGTPAVTAYMNHYLVNGGVIVPADGEPNDEDVLVQLKEAYAGREIVTVPGAVILEGGGGPHCITQQVPVGTPPRTRLTVSPSSLDRLEEVTAKDRAAWRRWLAEHHTTSPGVWLILAKKRSEVPSVSLEEAGLEALCFGWIDSKRLPLDAHRYRQSYVPRRPTSTWSKVNKDRVERLIREGSMTEAGRSAIATAKANGSWASLDGVEALSIPGDLAAALAADPIARANFDAFAPSVKKLALQRVNAAKRAETRSRRIEEIVGQARAADRPTRSG